eukprot:Protomagalhaensia_wolfi_Nauph_80__111@NODE_1061_length_1764_cov_3_422029_g805_i0_p1_GENE_NODE_1061_length_1764_cov_3_422029_g805_i0NODE_1061_length_1764_cov_3_422029_g805_i0_p1_ORF_typecomplete_len476_score42_03Fumble/PF03630_14/1_6e65_NODE_1061_length_1764_cov_3_422029_g805_i0981525
MKLDLPLYAHCRRRRVYCFLLDLGGCEVFLRRAFAGMDEILCNVSDATAAEKAESGTMPKFPVYITGSGASKFADRACQVLEAYRQEGNKARFTIDFRFQRELQSILRSLDFLLMKLPSLFFHYDSTLQGVTDSGALPPSTIFRPQPLKPDDLEDFYPYLLVNMKAGVSFHLVTSATESVRVGGSTIGCSTFVGLVRLLTGTSAMPFDVFLFAQEGDQSTVDMLVKDIYGGDYESVGLKASIVASTLGKLQNLRPHPSSVASDSHEQASTSLPLAPPHLQDFGHNNSLPQPPDFPPSNSSAADGRSRTVYGLQVRDVLAENSEYSERVQSDYASDQSEGHDNMSRVQSVPNIHLNGLRRCKMDSDDSIMPSEADVAKSLLSMMSFNVAQLAYFNAVLHNCKRLVFIGYYLEFPGYLAAIQHCVDFWSQKQCRVHFIRVAPFLGCFGATLERRYRSNSEVYSDNVFARETPAHERE